MPVAGRVRAGLRPPVGVLRQVVGAAVAHVDLAGHQLAGLAPLHAGLLRREERLAPRAERGRHDQRRRRGRVRHRDRGERARLGGRIGRREVPGRPARGVPVRARCRGVLGGGSAGVPARARQARRARGPSRPDRPRRPGPSGVRKRASAVAPATTRVRPADRPWPRPVRNIRHIMTRVREDPPNLTVMRTRHDAPMDAMTADGSFRWRSPSPRPPSRSSRRSCCCSRRGRRDQPAPSSRPGSWPWPWGSTAFVLLASAIEVFEEHPDVGLVDADRPRRRPHRARHPAVARAHTPKPTPAWMHRIETATPRKALRLAILLAYANPKVLLLTAAAGLSIGAAELGRPDGGGHRRVHGGRVALDRGARPALRHPRRAHAGPADRDARLARAQQRGRHGDRHHGHRRDGASWRALSGAPATRRARAPRAATAMPGPAPSPGCRGSRRPPAW